MYRVRQDAVHSFHRWVQGMNDASDTPMSVELHPQPRSCGSAETPRCRYVHAYSMLISGPLRPA